MTDTVGRIEQLSGNSEQFGNPEQFNEGLRTTIELRNEYGTYTISVNESNLDLYQMYDELIRPLLLASGTGKIKHKSRATIELRNEYGIYTVSVELLDFDLYEEQLENLIKPLLLAAGFHIDTIKEVFEDIEY